MALPTPNSAQLLALRSVLRPIAAAAAAARAASTAKAPYATSTPASTLMKDSLPMPASRVSAARSRPVSIGSAALMGPPQTRSGRWLQRRHGNAATARLGTIPSAGVSDQLRAPVVAHIGVALVDLDVLLADLLANLTLLGHGVGVQAHPLPGHDLLVNHGPLLVQDDLVLGLGELGAAGGRVQVGVGDRLTLQPDLLPPHRHGLGDLLCGHVLAQPHPPALAGLGADPQLLLRPGHRLIDASAGRVVARLAPAGTRAGGPVDHLGPWLGLRRPARLGGAVVQAVVAPQLLLFSLGQVLVGLDAWGVLDQLLVIGHLDVVVALAGLCDWHEGGLGAEQASLDQCPLRLPGLVVGVDALDAADTVAVAVDHGAALPATDGVDVGHEHAPSLLRSLRERQGMSMPGPDRPPLLRRRSRLAIYRPGKPSQTQSGARCPGRPAESSTHPVANA